jgi:hypothetical protein
MTTRFRFWLGALGFWLFLAIPALAQQAAPNNPAAPEPSLPIAGYFCGISSAALVLLVVCYPVRRD